MSSATGRELALARVFHAAHAKDWCESFRAGDPELDLERLRDRAKNAGAAERQVACDVCATFAERGLRIGAADSYVASPDKEPLCGLIASPGTAVQYVYQADNGAGDRGQLARTFCGCEASTVAVHVAPSSTVLAPGRSAQLFATVDGTGDTRVIWSADGGTITPDGLFTAGSALGTFTVRATSVVDPSAFGEANVTVTQPSMFVGTYEVVSYLEIFDPPTPPRDIPLVVTISQTGMDYRLIEPSGLGCFPGPVEYALTVADTADGNMFTGPAVACNGVMPEVERRVTGTWEQSTGTLVLTIAHFVADGMGGGSFVTDHELTLVACVQRGRPGFQCSS